jgi:hypothetical protein
MLLSGILITLASSHHVFEALDAIETLNEPFIKCETIPAPREITSKCGVSLLCAHPDSPLWAGSLAYSQSAFWGLKKNEKRVKIENSVRMILDIILKLDIQNREIYTVNLDFINKRKFYDQKT